MCDERVWASVAHVLGAECDVHVVVPGMQPTMQAQAEAVLAAAPSTFSLAGFSMGGYIALEIMRQQPQRIDRLALLATRAGVDAESVRALRIARMERVRRGELCSVTKEFAQAACGERLWRDRGAATAVLEMFQSQRAATYLAQQAAMLSRSDSKPLLPHIRCPVMVACGTQDLVAAPACHAAIAVSVPNGRLHRVEGAGHMLPMEAPEAVTGFLTEWMRRDSARGTAV
jgi:pimeloyl-ACP methyl ester carboxylesterase